jgi:1-acyl-sn-glycerol-3-phosphate acyltransferase
VLLWTLPAVAVQAVLLLGFCAGKAWFARLYWRGIARILGLRLRVLGAPCRQRPCLFVANHCSWVDIAALGAVLPGCFIAKAEIGRWPGIGLIARLGRTVFVSRGRGTLAREQRLLERRLEAGDNIILFPEGTTSDGNRVLPFASAFFTIAFGKAAPWVQAVTIVYDRLENQPVRRPDRPLIAWYGEMELAPHLLALLRRGGLRATILLDEPQPAGRYRNRKTLSAAMERHMSETAAALRQGRLPVTGLQSGHASQRH